MLQAIFICPFPLSFPFLFFLNVRVEAASQQASGDGCMIDLRETPSFCHDCAFPYNPAQQLSVGSHTYIPIIPSTLEAVMDNETCLNTEEGM